MEVDFQIGGGGGGILDQIDGEGGFSERWLQWIFVSAESSLSFFVPLDLLAQCLWVLCGFFFAVVVGCCCGGEMVCCCGGGVGCCPGSIGTWWWGFAMVVGVGFTMVGLWWRQFVVAEEAVVFVVVFLFWVFGRDLWFVVWVIVVVVW